MRNVFSLWSASPFPPQMSFHLPWFDDVQTLSNGAGGLAGAESIYRLNSIFDPDYSGTGHVPLQYTQLAALYRKYRVTSTSIKVVARNSTINSAIVLVQVQDSASTQAVTGYLYRNVQERKGAAWIMPNVYTVESQPVEINHTVSMAALDGITYPKFVGNEDYDSLMTTNPTLQTFLRVAVADVGGQAAGATTVQIQVQLVFHGYAFDRIDQAPA